MSSLRVIAPFFNDKQIHRDKSTTYEILHLKQSNMTMYTEILIYQVHLSYEYEVR
jgi:hypothetical protein